MEIILLYNLISTVFKLTNSYKEIFDKSNDSADEYEDYDEYDYDDI